MSAATYREAVTRYRAALDLLGPYAGPCGLCGVFPDRRHRLADAVAGAVLAGETPEDAAAEYLPDGRSDAARIVLEVTVAVLAADPIRHRLTRNQASPIDLDVWADLIDQPTKEMP